MKWIIENPNDMIQQHLINGRFYDQDHLEYMKDHISAGDVILDIGANVGNHTVYFSKFTEAELIYVIEPIPVSYKMLLCNIALNYCHNVNVDHIGVGLGSFECTAYPFTVYGKDNLGSTRMFNTPDPAEFIEDHIRYFKEPPWKHQPVKIVTGDSIFADKKIDFIKVDAEGMDLVILDGLRTTIQANRPKIFIEITNDNLLDFHMWIELNDYKIIKKFTHGAYNPDDPYSGENYLIGAK